MVLTVRRGDSALNPSRFQCDFLLVNIRDSSCAQGPNCYAVGALHGAIRDTESRMAVVLSRPVQGRQGRNFKLTLTEVLGEVIE